MTSQHDKPERWRMIVSLLKVTFTVVLMLDCFFAGWIAHDVSRQFIADIGPPVGPYFEPSSGFGPRFEPRTRNFIPVEGLHSE